MSDDATIVTGVGHVRFDDNGNTLIELKTAAGGSLEIIADLNALQNIIGTLLASVGMAAAKVGSPVVLPFEVETAKMLHERNSDLTLLVTAKGGVTYAATGMGELFTARLRDGLTASLSDGRWPRGRAN
jgi:hypothetical protein